MITGQMIWGQIKMNATVKDEMREMNVVQLGEVITEARRLMFLQGSMRFG